MVQNETKAEGKCSALHDCQNVVFHSDESTAVTEWNLLCDRAWILSIIISIEMTGSAIGSFLSGRIADRFGRKRTLSVSILFCFIFSMATPFSVSWKMFAAMRFLSCLGSSAASTLQALILLEFTPPKYRVMIISFPSWNINVVLFGILLSQARDWRIVHWSIACVCVLAFITSLFIPESLRWLAVQGRSEEAKAVALKFCKYNRKAVPEEAMSGFASSEGEKSEKRAQIRPLFKTHLLKRTVCTNLIMFFISMTYFALYFGIQNLHGNLYINMILFCSITIPLAPLTPVLSHKLGRKGGNITFLGVSTAMCCAIIAVSFVMEESSLKGWLITGMALSISSCLDQTWCAHMSHSAEMFPTSVRASAFSLIKISARVGGIAAPYIIPRSMDTMYVYYIIAASLLLVCIGMLLALPETVNTPMSDNMNQIKEAESRGRRKIYTGPEAGEPKQSEAFPLKDVNEHA